MSGSQLESKSVTLWGKCEFLGCYLNIPIIKEHNKLYKIHDGQTAFKRVFQRSALIKKWS